MDEEKAEKPEKKAPKKKEVVKDLNPVQRSRAKRGKK